MRCKSINPTTALLPKILKPMDHTDDTFNRNRNLQILKPSACHQLIHNVWDLSSPLFAITDILMVCVNSIVHYTLCTCVKCKRVRFIQRPCDPYFTKFQ